MKKTAFIFLLMMLSLVLLVSCNQSETSEESLTTTTPDITTPIAPNTTTVITTEPGLQEPMPGEPTEGFIFVEGMDYYSIEGIREDVLVEELVIPATYNGKPVMMIGGFSLHPTITSVYIPDGVLSIMDLAFAGCEHLEYVRIPETLSTIENSAFAECPNLTSIYLPESVVKMGEGVFWGDESLTIYCQLKEYPRNNPDWHFHWNATGCPVVWDYAR